MAQGVPIISVAGSTLEINGTAITFVGDGDFIKLNPTGDIAKIVRGGDGQGYAGVFDQQGLVYKGIFRVFAYADGDNTLLNLVENQINGMNGSSSLTFLNGSITIPLSDGSVKTFTLNGILFSKAPLMPPLNQNASTEAVIREYEVEVGEVIEN